MKLPSNNCMDRQLFQDFNRTIECTILLFVIDEAQTLRSIRYILILLWLRCWFEWIPFQTFRNLKYSSVKTDYHY